MSMFPHWYGSQKMATPQSDTICLNCHRMYDGELSPDRCPFCGSGLTQLAADLGNAPVKNKLSKSRSNPVFKGGK